MDTPMDKSKMRARWAGLCLLLGLAGIGAILSVMPSFDARAEYFGGWFPGLILQRFRFAGALGLAAVTGVFVIAAGLALYGALWSARTRGSAVGFVFLAAGGGFLLSALLGLPCLSSYWKPPVHLNQNGTSLSRLPTPGHPETRLHC
jgi:MFS family permease